jgi:translation initiation factor 1
VSAKPPPNPSAHPFAKLQALRTPEPARPQPPFPISDEDRGPPSPPVMRRTPGSPVALPASPPTKAPPLAKRADKPAPDADQPKGPAWAVVRLERKGRAGKEATIVEKLALAAPELERWCKELKQSLGCGGVVEGDSIVLQGDLRSRLPAVLTKRGVRKVTVS